MSEQILKHILEDLMGHMKEEEEKEEHPVGTVSDDLRKEYKAMNRIKRELRADMKHRKKQLEIEAEHQFKKEFMGRIEDVEDKKSELWGRVYKELNIDDLEQNEEYSIDPATGQVSVHQKPIDFT